MRSLYDTALFLAALAAGAAVLLLCLRLLGCAIDLVACAWGVMEAVT